MVSLVELSEVTEEGVKFKSPYDGKEILLSPEKSISIQNSLGLQQLHFFFYQHLLCLYSLIYCPLGNGSYPVSIFFVSFPRVRHHDAAG